MEVTTMPTIKLTGSIFNAATGEGLPNLGVEAWGRTGDANKQFGETTTNAEGKFVIEFTISDQALSRRPVGVIKIFSGDTLLHTSPEQPIGEWVQQRPFVIKLDPPTTPQNAVQLFVSASLANGRPAAGVRLELSYELSAGGTWTSQPVTANANGKLTVDLPTASPGSIDWSRIGFAFSKNDKPLRVIDRTSPEPVQSGFAIAIKLSQDTIPWPPKPDPNKWYVRGRVSTPYGEAVVANVSGAAISLQSEKSLGQVPTSGAGRYEIVYEWDGKCAPDIQVSATVQDKLVAQSPIRFAAGKSVRIDLIAGNELYIGPTEFQRVEDRVLRCNDDFDISVIGKKQFDYLLGKTGLAENRLGFYLVARKLHSLCEVPTAVFYGLFRAKLPSTLQGLVLQPPKVLQKALDKAIQQNIIDRKYQNAFDSLLAALRQMAVAGSLHNSQQLGRAGVGDLLTIAEVPASAQQQLISLYLEHDGDDAAFWHALGKDKQLSPYADKTKTALQIGALTTYHPPTMQAFKTKLGAASTINDLASWQNKDWQAFGRTLQSVPDSVPGDSLAERIGFYVETMSRTVKRAFAREYTTANVLRSKNFADPVLHEFLKAVPDFDYGNSSISAVLDKTQITGESRKALEKTLKSLQRLYRVAPIEDKFTVLDTLYAGGLTSSRDIALQGSAQFIDLYGDAFGGAEIAAYVYDKAATVTAVSTNVLTGYSDLFNASGVYAVGGGVPISHPDANSDLAIPSYQDLFGSQSFCECVDCSSVCSPAAYFVDLLEYLRQSLVTKKIGGKVYVKIIKNGVTVNKTGLDVLFARRGDLGDIRLDCANTNTLLPYIDLVNEIFERGVVGETDSSPYQTTWTEQELKTNPEHILSGAYDVLAETTYPLTLPFRLWNVEADYYLNHLGASRPKLMEKLIKTPSSGNAGFEQVSLSYLGLTALDVEILKGAPAYSGTLTAVSKMWGYTVLGWRTSLASVPEFLKRSGLSYDELLQLLQVPYVQADGQVGIDFSDADSACDINGAVLRYVVEGKFDAVQLLSKETFDRIQRFLRLRNKTGWSIWKLGRVLAALPLPQLTLKTLVQVSTLKQLADLLALDILEALSWWAKLDTALDTTDPDYRSLYESVFLNPAVLNPPDPVFLLEEPNRTRLAVEGGAGALISDHFSSIAAALQVSEATAILLAESLPDDALTLNNLSRMYRIASLCRALDIDISQYFLMARLIAADPWNAAQPQSVMQFIAAVQAQQTSAFTSAELGYLLLHDEASVATTQMPATAIANLLREIQVAVRAVWIRYVLSNSPSFDQLNARLADYFAQETIDSIITIVGQALPYSPEDQAYLQETLSFLAPVELKNAVAQSKPANVRYKNLLVLLNRYGRTSGSVNVVAQIIADIFTLDLAVAQLLLTEVVSRSAHPGGFVIDALLEPLFIDSGKEKLAAAVAAEFLQDAFSIVEGTSTLTDSDIEAFIVAHFDFLDSEEAKTKLLGSDALSDVVARYQYVSAPLDEAQYTLSEEVFAEQFAAVWTIQKSALVVNKFQITETELPLLNQHAATLQVLPVKGYPFVDQERNFVGFKAWQNLANLVSLRRVFVATDSQLFAQLENALNPNLIDIGSVNAEVDALIASGSWQESDRTLLVWLHDLATATGWQFSECIYVAGPELLAASLPDMLNVATLVYLTDVIELAVRLGTTAAQLKAWSGSDLSQTDAANAKQTARARYTLEQWYGIAPALRDVLREKQRDALTAYMLYLGGFGTTVELYNHYLIDAEMSACMLTSRLKLALSSVQLFLQRCLLNLEDEFVAVTAAEEWEWRKNYRVWEANRKVFLYPENYIKPELQITRSEIFDAAQSVLLQNEVTEDVAELALQRYLDGLDNISSLEVAGSFHETGLAEDGVTAIDRLHVVGRSRGIPRKYYYRVRDGLAWSPWQEIDADISADQVIPVVMDSRLYLFWPAFFEKQIAGSGVLSNSAMQDAKEGEIEYDEYLDYLLHYDFGISGSHASLYSDGYSSLAEFADALTVTVDEAVEIMVEDVGADTWEVFLDSAIERFDGKFEETFNYFEIKLSVSEYKNGHWMPSRISEDYIESDQKNSALALLDENQIPATPGDFNFYTTIDGDIVTVECLQTLRYTDGDYAYPYVEGDFEYNILSKEILAFDHKDERRGFGIETPSGADVVANRFVEDEQRMLEIPLVSGGWWQTTYVTLLEQTPGTFRLPVQHQYEQFAASDAFFFGDDKRSFIVSPDKASSLLAQYQGLEADSPLLEGYLNSANPGMGVYDALIDDFFSATTSGINSLSAPASAKGSSRRAKVLVPSKTLSTGPQDLLAGLEDTSVAEFYPLMQDVYRFESFYHPLVGDLIKKMNGEGTATALSRDTQRTSEKYFIAAYQPTDDVAEDLPIRDFSFSDLDANGFYNYELFFHLPLLIAVRLSKNQQFAEAQKWFHSVFDPTSRSAGEGAQRFWQFKPFFDMYDNTAGHPFDSIYDMLSALAADPTSADSATLELKRQIEEQIAVWRANPFDPHAIAALRPVAYMKTVVMEYLNNLIAWGDYLYEQFTHESINEATLYYMLAYQILGERAVALPELKVVEQSYNQLGELDAFSNAVAELENLINLPEAPPSSVSPPPPLYFCIPNNPTLLQYWDTVADRLFKIRHCMTIEGVVQQLPLFEPPINPALLVLARASGVSIGAALASLATPAPHYRFVFLMQKAVEYCQVVKSLGSQLLAAYEKKDAEGLSMLRAEHENSLLKASTELRNLQVDEARENLAAMEKSKALVEERIDYYSNLEKRSEKEVASTKSLDDAELKRMKSSDKEMAASRLNLVPNISVTVGMGTSVGTSYGGSNIGASLSADAAKSRGESAWNTYKASKLGTDASYERRWDDWQLQKRLAKNELKQIDKQIIAAQVRLALAEKERDNHAVQMQQSREVKDFLSSKFSNQELYGWMVSQTSAIYFQSYKLAYDLAKRCEKAYQRESGEYSSTYIAYGYFDSLKKGLMSGERLHHDLQRMEFDYLNNNRREYEITKHVSLSLLDPVALLELQTEGECEFSIPEALFDMEYPGHYFRRIRSIDLSIPCVTGPYTSVPARLTLVSSRTRIDPTASGEYSFDPSGEDARFQLETGGGQSIVVSRGQEDPGLFAADHRDERYLPFEGTGAISDWNLKLTSAMPTFDWTTMTDVVLHVRYTAREGGDLLREAALASISLELSEIPLRRAFSAKHEFPTEWSAFLRPAQGGSEPMLKLDLSEKRFPYFARALGLNISDLQLVALVKDPENAKDITADVEGAGTTNEGVTLASADGIYDGNPSANIGYQEADPGEWKITVDTSTLGAPSEWIDDLVVIATYQVSVPI
jgi:hypothetical protein